MTSVLSELAARGSFSCFSIPIFHAFPITTGPLGTHGGVYVAGFLAAKRMQGLDGAAVKWMVCMNERCLRLEK